VVLDKPEGRFVMTDNVVAQALTLAFLAIIVFIQGVAAFAKGVHHQLAFFHFGHKIIRLLGRRLAGFMLGHPFRLLDYILKGL